MKKIIQDMYHIGDSGCSVFLVDTKSKDGLVLIDCGMSFSMIKNIAQFGLDPMRIKHCILTHFHIDHIAACYEFKQFNNDINYYAHELDADAIEQNGHDTKTAASWYGVKYEPIKLKKRLKERIEVLRFGNLDFKCIHTPGHTPGSISVFVEVAGKKVLFGQDIHGPFMKSFGSNLRDYQNSMKFLLDLNPDILCEGHYGIIKSREEVKKYIKHHMKQNRP